MCLWSIGRGASGLGGWRVGGIDAFVFNMQPFYVSDISGHQSLRIRDIAKGKGFPRRANIVLPSCPKSNMELTCWEGHFISRCCWRDAYRRNKTECLGVSCGNHTHNDKYVHVVFLVKLTRNARATCLPFP